MEFDEFEYEKKENKNVKKKSERTAIVAFICIVVVAGIYLGKNHIKPIGEKLSASVSVFKKVSKQNENSIEKKDNNKSGKISFETGAKTSFAVVGKNYFYCTKDGIKFLDFNGNQLWNYTYTLNSPLAISEGECFAVAETQGKAVQVYNREGELYSLRTDSAILQMSLNKEGALALILKDSGGYKIQLYNKTGQLLMERMDHDEGVFPLSLDISNDEKILAVSYIDTNEIEVAGKILFFNSNKNDAKNSESGDFFASISKNGTFIPVLKCMDNGNFIAVGDSIIFCLDSSGNELWSVEVNNKIDKVAFGNGTHTIIALGEAIAGRDGVDNGTIVIIDEKGSSKSNISMGRPVTYLSAYKTGIVAGVGREYTSFSYSGNINWNHTATQDVKDIILLSSSNMALYVTNSSCQVMDMKK